MAANQTFDLIKAKAKEIGFSEIAVCRPKTLERDSERLKDFIDNNEFGTMEWFKNNQDVRANAKNYWSEAKSIIVCAINYKPSFDPMVDIDNPKKALISVYAQDIDYHKIIKKYLKALTKWMQETMGGEYRSCIDTSPVLEKSLAAQTAIGWIGKHGNVVSKKHGSWLFLSEVYTTLDLAPDKPSQNLCGSCTRCMDACPTNALDEPYKLNVKLCLAYLNNEHKGKIPDHLAVKMGNRLFGCDDCIASCPWNKFASTSHNLAKSIPNQNPQYFIDLSPEDFLEKFKDTPLKRLGYSRFMRNLFIVITNMKRQDLKSKVQSFTSNPDQLISETANWCVEQLQQSNS